MKPIHRILAGGALAACLSWASSASAQDYIVNLFDSAAEAAQWGRWWGSAPQTYQFDGAVDANNNPSSGSLRVTVQLDLAAYRGDNQFSALRNLESPINGLNYTNLEMDILFDSSSPQRPWGDLGRLEYGIRHSDWSQDYFGFIDVPVTNNWIHLVARIPIANPGIDDIAGITFKMWSGDASWGQTGELIMWVDNIKLIAKTGDPLPPPTLSIERATPGLNLFASQAGAQYQRQGIRTVGTNFSWVPVLFDLVTYHIGIKEYPEPNYNGFQTHLFLIPEAGMPSGPNDTFIDWNAPNVVFFHIENHSDGTGLGRFMYKTNQPSGNSMLWNDNPANGPVGTLAFLPSPQPQGNWSLTFDNMSGSITMTEPSGTSTNFPMMPAAAVALFNNPLYAYVGVQPNNTNNIGQRAVLEYVVMRSEDPAFPYLEDPFAGSQLNPALWNVVAANAAGIVVVPPEAVYWISWSLPAIGFSLQSSPSLNPPSWTTLVPSVQPQIGSRRMGLIRLSDLPAPDIGFFKMAKP